MAEIHIPGYYDEWKDCCGHPSEWSDGSSRSGQEDILGDEQRTRKRHELDDAKQVNDLRSVGHDLSVNVIDIHHSSYFSCVLSGFLNRP